LSNLNILSFPKDSNNVPYYDNADDGGYLTMPVEQYIRSGGLFVPISATNPQPVKSVASDTGEIASDTITRPANTTAYEAGDVISTTSGEILNFASLGVANQMITIMGVRLMIADGAVPSGCAGYRLHLYNASPTVIADAAPYNLPSGDRAKYLGFIDRISVPTDLGDTVFSTDDGVNFTCKLASTGLYGILQTVGAETPASAAVYTITLLTVAI